MLSTETAQELTNEDIDIRDTILPTTRDLFVGWLFLVILKTDKSSKLLY